MTLSVLKSGHVEPLRTEEARQPPTRSGSVPDSRRQILPSGRLRPNRNSLGFFGGGIWLTAKPRNAFDTNIHILEAQSNTSQNNKLIELNGNWWTQCGYRFFYIYYKINDKKARPWNSLFGLFWMTKYPRHKCAVWLYYCIFYFCKFTPVSYWKLVHPFI